MAYHVISICSLDMLRIKGLAVPLGHGVMILVYQVPYWKHYL